MGGVRSQPESQLSETARGDVLISSRNVAIALLAIVVAAVAARWLDDEQAAFAALTLVTAPTWTFSHPENVSSASAVTVSAPGPQLMRSG